MGMGGVGTQVQRTDGFPIPSQPVPLVVVEVVIGRVQTTAAAAAAATATATAAAGAAAFRRRKRPPAPAVAAAVAALARAVEVPAAAAPRGRRVVRGAVAARRGARAGSVPGTGLGGREEAHVGRLAGLARLVLDPVTLALLVAPPVSHAARALDVQRHEAGRFSVAKRVLPAPAIFIVVVLIVVVVLIFLLVFLLLLRPVTVLLLLVAVAVAAAAAAAVLDLPEPFHVERFPPGGLPVSERVAMRPADADVLLPLVAAGAVVVVPLASAATAVTTAGGLGASAATWGRVCFHPTPLAVAVAIMVATEVAAIRALASPASFGAPRSLLRA